MKRTKRTDFEDVNIGDMVIKVVSGTRLHYIVQAKGFKFQIKPNWMSPSSTDQEQILFVKCAEFPEWNNPIITIHDKIVRIIKPKEKVEFT